MADATIPGLFLTGDHASRPAANTVGTGSLYACSDHTKIYQSDGSSWSDWFDPTGLSGGSVVVPWTIGADGGNANVTNRTVGAANRAVYVPVTIPADCTINGIKIAVGTQNGNISVALYSGTSRVATSGAVACPATGLQSVNFSAPYAASAGRFYAALTADNNTATFAFHQQVTSGVAGTGSALFEATAHPAPATASMTAGISPFSFSLLVNGGFPT